MSVNMKFNSLVVTIVWPIQGLEVHYKTHYPDKNENVPIVIYYLLLIIYLLPVCRFRYSSFWIDQEEDCYDEIITFYSFNIFFLFRK